MSSVVPADPVSSTGNKKKARPGKTQRLAARGGSLPGGESAVTAPSSMSKASLFAAGVSGPPVPQPGKYPVVFPSGAGEPTRDAFFAYDGELIGSVIAELPGRYSANSRYAEFSSHAELTPEDFDTHVSQSAYLGLAQQTVHSHVNMGLPMGDFSAVSSSDISNFSAVRSILSQFGEFSQESLGTRFLLKGYETTVTALVRAAVLCDTNTSYRVGTCEWLPTVKGDIRTRFVVASKLAKFVEPLGVKLDVNRLAEDVFVRTSDIWEVVKPLLGDPPSPTKEGQPGRDLPRDRFDFLFSRFNDEKGFFNLVGDGRRRKLLQEIGLDWPEPDVSDLMFSMNPKVEFGRLADALARSRATYAKFFSSGSGTGNRAVAAGSSVQLSRVETRDGITLVKSLLAQAAPEYSLLVCFPSSALTANLSDYNVVLTTSLSVGQRATEFSQMDWL
ncbi:capsid protein [Thelebolus microsporus partitivirus 1]|nr:capsid protein [Thelebolus microsporus partitivirus 1]